MSNIDALADSVATTVKGYVGERFKAFEASIAETFRKMVDALPKPKDGVDGKDADEKAITANVLGDVLKALEKIPPPKDGAPGEKGLDGINGKDGAPGADGLKGDAGDQGAKGERGEKGDPGEPGPAGKDGAPGMPGAAGERGLPGENGKDGAPGADGLKGDPGLNGKDGAPGIDGKKGADGINGKDADPEVILRMVKDAFSLVPVPKDGKDGNDGKSVILEEVLSHLKSQLEGEVGQWELDFERRAEDRFQRLVDRMPRPKDGLGFDDMTVEDVDERTIALVFTRGDEKKRFEKSWPVVIDRGTFKMGDTYERGDAVTYGGSLFIAQRDTLPTERPEDGSGAFRLAVKRGRDGGGS